jgi:hypothetical protein
MTPPVTDAPVVPGREQAQAWAIEELSKREYDGARPGLTARFYEWVAQIFDGAPTPGRSLTVLLITITVALLAALTVWVVIRAGGLRRAAHRAATSIHDRVGTTSKEHRAAADRFAATGQWADAVIERFRAVTRSLEENDVLADQPGRTAVEFAREAGVAIPGLATEFGFGAELFDDACYGHRTMRQDADTRLRGLDDQITRARAGAVRAGARS